MAMPLIPIYSEWTVDLLDALPQSAERFELIDGELFVTPSPGIPHQGVILTLAAALLTYTRAEQFGRTIISPSDVRRDDFQKNRVQPDIYVVRLTDDRLPDYPFHLRELMLAIEVISPGNPVLDYHIKRGLYLAEGVGEYWIIDIDRQILTRFRQGQGEGEVFTDRIEWRPIEARTTFAVELPALFAEARGELRT
ncbi:MAG: Uma2 family endonuclease [Gemmatimonadaceae bacterium]